MSDIDGRPTRLVASRTTGSLLALVCLGLLGVMPLLANARPEASDGLVFAVFLSLWQLIAALPLYLVEAAGARRQRGGMPRRRTLERRILERRTLAIALLTGALFGASTYMYVVAADKAGPVSMVIVLQAYPLFAMLWERLFLGRTRTWPEIGFTLLMIAALVYLATGGTMTISGLSWWSVYALGIPLLWSIAHFLLKGVLDRAAMTPSEVTESRLAISSVFLLLALVATGGLGGFVSAVADLDLQRAALVLGIAYYLELILWFNAIRHIDVSLASSITVPAPAVTILISLVVLGGAVQPHEVLAMVVVVAGMWGLLLSGRR